jgi:hypothetical protein
MTMPDFILYAVLKNNTVVDCGIGDNKEVLSLMSQQNYKAKDGFEFVEMTIQNSPAELGMIYNNNKFYFERKTNV